MRPGGRRDARKEKFWRRMVRGQARSGRTIRVWCREHDLKEPAFYWWRARLAQSEPKRRPRPPTLVPVRVSAPEAPGAEGTIEIALREDRCIRVRGRVDRRVLADVLAVLEAPLC